MGYRYRRKSYRANYSGRRSYSSGYERAQQHIEEAKALSARLGGADDDVKGFLFSLSGARIATFLDAYEGLHGSAARKYAEEIIPKWRSGQVKMSGMVAGRLFDLMPRLMRPEERLALTERLWKHFGPSSHTRFRIGIDVSSQDVARAIEQHVMGTIQDHQIPENVRTQFSWLSGGDAVAKEVLLNHIRALERSIAVEAARRGSYVLLEHMRAQDGKGLETTTASQTISIGKHRVDIVIDRSVKGCKQEDPRIAATVVRSAGGSGLGWLILVAVIIVAVLLFGRR